MPRVLVRATECAHAHTRHEHSGACRCPLHACSSRCQACTCTTCNEHVGMSTASAGRMQDGSAEQRQRRHGEERPAPTESERASRRRREVVKCSGERKKERSPVHPKKRTFTRPKNVHQFKPTPQDRSQMGQNGRGNFRHRDNAPTAQSGPRSRPHAPTTVPPTPPTPPSTKHPALAPGP